MAAFIDTATVTWLAATAHGVDAIVRRKDTTAHSRAACSKRPLSQCPSSAPAPAQGAPGDSGQLGTPRNRPGHWPPSHCLGPCHGALRRARRAAHPAAGAQRAAARAVRDGGAMPRLLAALGHAAVARAIGH
eukprot:scaffold74710_cov51-Phaeocystis_antarctica.AAC.1